MIGIQKYIPVVLLIMPCKLVLSLGIESLNVTIQMKAILRAVLSRGTIAVRGGSNF